MATATFDDILSAQRETNELLSKQRNPLDGRTGAGKALLDASKEQLERQSETTSAIRDLDVATAGQIDDPKPPKPPKSPKSAQEEITKKTKSEQDKRFDKLGNIFKKQLSGVKSLLDNLNKAAKGGLFAALTAAGFFALAKFLESDTWKNIRELLIEKLPPILDELYKNIILPVFNFLKDTFTNFWQDILDFFEEPTIEGLGKLIGENVVALGIIAGLLAPSLLTTPLKAAVSLLGGAFTTLLGGFKALLAPFAVPIAIAAGVVTVLVAFVRSLKTFETKLAEGEGIFMAIASALGTFFVELFKIPAEFIASLIPEDIKEKFFTITGDVIDAIVKFTKGFTDAILPENFKENFSIIIGDAIDSAKVFFGELFSSIFAPFKRAVEAYKNAGGGLIGAGVAIKSLIGSDGEAIEALPQLSEEQQLAQDIANRTGVTLDVAQERAREMMESGMDKDMRNEISSTVITNVNNVDQSQGKGSSSPIIAPTPVTDKQNIEVF
tara:strand:+ start:2467 stop:3954 length:1488 start_codon:yes stop_codon:yes gene_type:complete